MSKLAFIRLSGNHFTDVCFRDFKESKSVIVLDLSQNALTKLGSKCVIPFFLLKHLFLSKNKIDQFECNILKSNSKINILDLSHNRLTELKTCMFDGISHSIFLNLYGNQIHTLYSGMFDSITNSIIKTSLPILCCLEFKYNIKCTLTKTKTAFHGCKTLVSGKIEKIITWLVAIVGIFFNIVSLGFSIYCIKLKVKGVRRAYQYMVISLSSTHCCHCILLLYVAIADNWFGDGYPYFDYYWRKSPLCHLVSYFSLFFNVMELFLITFLALSRYKAIESL